MKNKFLITLLLIGVLNFSCEDQEMLNKDNRNDLGTLNTNADFSKGEKFACDLPDPSITAIDIDYGSFPPYIVKPGTTVKFSYTFNTTNLGVGLLSLKDGLVFQTYVSKDAHFGGADDVPAGGAVYVFPGQQDIVLSYGQTHTDSWGNYSGADLYEYKYLIVEVKSEKEFNECTASNNYFIKYIDIPRLDGVIDPGPFCDLPDPSITAITIDYSSFPPNIITPGATVSF